MSSSHKSDFAELYDLFYESKPYTDEAKFIDLCIRENGRTNSKRLLELACGTGNHALALESLGYHVHATDYSPDILAIAKSKAQREGSNITFSHQDMRKINLPEKTFDAVICMFDSIGFVQTNDALRSTLRGVFNVLEPGGLFIFEFWHSPAMLKKFDPVRILRKDTPAGEILRISETSVDVSRQLASVSYSIYRHNSDSTYSIHKEVQINRFFALPEMQMFIADSGFDGVEWFSGFSNDRAIGSDTWHVICIARKPKLANVD